MGGGGSQTSTQKSEPWSGQQPYLKDLFREGQGLYRQGPQEFYPGTTVAPFAPQQQQAMDMITNRALSGSPQEQAFGNYLTGALGQQNLDPQAMFGHMGSAANILGGMTGYGGIGESSQYAGDPRMGALPASENFARFGMNTGAVGANQLANTAAGGYLGSNPYLDQVYDTAASRAGEAFNEQTMPGIAAMFGDAGRTGSGIQQQVVGNAARQFGRDLQGLAGDIYAPAYESERDRMTQAAQGGANFGLGSGQLGADTFSAFNQNDLGRRNLGADLYLGERGLGQQAAGMYSDIGNTLSNMYGNVGQNQFRAGSLTPTYSGLEYGNLDRLMGVGNQIQGQAQDIIGGNMARWGFEQQAPWDNLNNYASIIQGLPGGYGTQTSTQPKGSKLGGAIGGAMAGAPLGPWGMAGGALMGLLG